MVNYKAMERFESLLNREAEATQDARRAEIGKWKNLPSEIKDRVMRGQDDPESRLKGMGCFVYLNSDRPYFISRGSHQAVIDVGDGLVAKLPVGYQFKEIRDSMERDFPNLIPLGKDEYRYTKEVIDNLRGLGFEVPDMEFFRIHWVEDRIKVDEKVSHGKRMKIEPAIDPYPNAIIMRDFRENGRFAVHDYNEELARSLPNGNRLSSQFESGFAKLMDHYGSIEEIFYERPGIYLTVKPHGYDYTPETAIRKMFMFQIPVNPRDEGKLVLGDLDHVLFFEL